MSKFITKTIIALSACALLVGIPRSVEAQGIRIGPQRSPEIATNSPSLASEAASIASRSAEELQKLEQITSEDVTRPEAPGERDELLSLFEQRKIERITPLNFMAFAVQFSVLVGVPARTIVLILLLPLLASVIAFLRHIVGVPGIGMLLPIALSITLLSTGLTAGLILLVSILFASTIARFILKKIRIMQLPKMALSMFIVSIFIFISLTASAVSGILIVKQLSIFPVLLLILLSEQIVAVQMERTAREIFHVTFFTIALGVLGFLLLSFDFLRNTILLYPELILFLIPLDIVIGRYFGLRFTEVFRFSSITHGSK